MNTVKDILERYHLKEFTFVDVGAKDQLDYCPVLAERTNMHAFEPNPVEHRRLAERYRQHPFRSLHLVEKGLGNRQGEASFWITRHNSMSSLLEPDLAHYAMHFGAYQDYPRWEDSIRPDQEIRISLQTADDYFSPAGTPIDYMKLDTQGSELMILQGAQSLLKENRIAMLKVEVSTIPVYKGQAVFSDIDQYLRAQHFMLVDFLTYRDAYQPLFGSKKRHAHHGPCGDALYVHVQPDEQASALMRKSILLHWQGYRSLADHFAKQAGAGPADLQTLNQMRSLHDWSFRRKLVYHCLPPAIRRLLKHA